MIRWLIASICLSIAFVAAPASAASPPFAIGAGEPAASLQGIKLAGTLLPLRLLATDLRPGSQYTGTLVLSMREFDTPQVTRRP